MDLAFLLEQPKALAGDDTHCIVEYTLDGIQFLKKPLRVAQLWLNGAEIGDLVYTDNDPEKTLDLAIGDQLVEGANVLRIQILGGTVHTPLFDVVFKGVLTVRSAAGTVIHKHFPPQAQAWDSFDKTFTIHH